jgi:hypothetical protein
MYVKVDYSARNMTVTILSVVLTIWLASLAYAFHRSRKVSPSLIIGCYYALLITLFITGSLEAYGYGWGFFPLVIATMPSYLLVSILPDEAGRWFASGYLGNFVLIVVLCGGLNSLLFYLIAMAIRHPPNPPKKVPTRF